jgi:enamine deaminase RidA (YjgF/YER057c/UK114 family)
MSKAYTKLCQILLPVALLAGAISAISDAADPLLRQYYTDERGALRLYSRAVVTEGGSTVWLAGQTTLEDAEGNSIAGDFAAQVRENFRLIETHLDQFGGDIHDIVTMTVYVADVRNADEYLVAKEEVFGDGPYPSSAFIGVYGFSRVGVEVEVKAVAVVGD